MKAEIAAALADTVTSHGGAFYDTYQTCQVKFRLQHKELITLRTEPRQVALDVGSLVHAVLRYAGSQEAAGQPWADWTHVLEAAPPLGYSQTDCETAQSLMDFYFLKWGVGNASYPAGAIIHSVEEEWRHDFGPLPTSARADTVLELGDEYLIVDHKTRSSKVPDGFERTMQTRPQFLRLASLWRAKFPDRPRASIWVNALVKTKLPSFSRHIVRLSDAALDAWCANQGKLAAEIASKDWKAAIANFGACDGGYFGGCEYRDWCHGSPDVRAAKYQSSLSKAP